MVGRELYGRPVVSALDDAIALMPRDPLLADAVSILRRDDFLAGIVILDPLPGGIAENFITQVSQLGVYIRLKISSGDIAMPRVDEKVSILIRENCTQNRTTKGGAVAFKTALDMARHIFQDTLNPAAPHPPDYFFEMADGTPVRRLMVPVPESYRVVADGQITNGGPSILAIEILCTMKTYVTADAPS